MKCYKLCELNKVECPVDDCRYWIDYDEDLNCTMIASDKHGPMTLREVAKRLKVSFVRIKQIETKANSKLFKKCLKKKDIFR